MRPTIAYQPALDGVRALAVLAVLLFHGGVAGFSGGYLGVSVFFTLSGYLITSLIVHEHATTGRVDLAAFYARRLRRLLPASALGLGLVVLAARFTDWFDRVENLREHVLGAVFQVANWVFLAGGGSYQDLLAEHAGTPSPLEHFWSLAIEEQFYWVWPPFLALVFARVATPRRRHAVVAAVTVAALAAAPVVAITWGADAAYWATPARIGEILAGAWVAVALSRRAGPLDRRWAYAAPAALVALGACVITWPAASGPAYRGALPLIAVGSVALLLGLQVDGPARRALAWAPLVWLGKVSYGVYLFHWPLYVVLDDERTGLDGAPLLAVRLAATLALAALSYYVVEQPIRHAAAPRRVTFGGALASTVAVGVAAGVLVPTGLGDYWEADAAIAEAASIDVTDTAPLIPAAAPTPTPAGTVTPATTTPDGTPPARAPSTIAQPTIAQPTTPQPTTGPPAPTVAPIPPLARPVRIVVTGDSTASALGAGVAGWAAANPELAQVEVAASAGCGFLTGGERRHGEGLVADACAGWVAEQLLPVAARTAPDVVVVVSSVWDVIDRRWDTGEPLTPLDDEYRARLLMTYTRLADDLVAAGAGRVAFVHEPTPDVWWSEQLHNEDEPARHAALHEVYAEIAAARPDRVAVIRFAEWFSAAGLDGDHAARPDGVHFETGTATRLVEEYLGDQMIRVALGLAVTPAGGT